MFLDHVTVGVPELAEPLESLRMAGIETEYGGVHSNGLTHMALASFGDGSYLEVVAPVAAGGRISLWSDFALPRDGGTAWTVAVEDAGAELTRAKAAGIGGRGPVTIKREKPDGEVGSWELAYLAGDAASLQPGGTLPFLIHDTTAREVRVPAKRGLNAGLRGWSAVVLAVHDQEASAVEFRRLYGWGPKITTAGTSYFPGTSVYLCSPPEHLDEFGESPWAGVLAPEQRSTADHLRYTSNSRLADKSVRWLNLSWKQLRIGVEIVL